MRFLFSGWIQSWIVFWKRGFFTRKLGSFAKLRQQFIKRIVKMEREKKITFLLHYYLVV